MSRPGTSRITVSLDGREYDLEVYRKVEQDPAAPRLIVVAYQGNPIASELLRACVRGVERYTPEPHELWVVDNNSPREFSDWLIDQPNVNVALNRTEPLPPEARGSEAAGQLNWGSYANAVGLELGLRVIDPQTRFLMTMHMDTTPCREGWLSYLVGKIQGKTAAAGVRMDTTRTPEGVLHVLGYMVDYRIFTDLGLDFFPELPQLDVGDRVTVKLREVGLDVFACPNTVWRPELAERIPESSPLRTFHADRSFDDEGNVIFLHLGRGLRRSTGEHQRGTTAEEWLRLVSDHLLADR